MTACLKAGMGNNGKNSTFMFSLFNPWGRIPDRSWITKAIDFLDCRLWMIIRRKRS